MRNIVTTPNSYSEPTIKSLGPGEMFRYRNSAPIYMKGAGPSIIALHTGTVYDSPSEGRIELVREVTIRTEVTKA